MKKVIKNKSDYFDRRQYLQKRKSFKFIIWCIGFTII